MERAWHASGESTRLSLLSFRFEGMQVSDPALGKGAIWQLSSCTLQVSTLSVQVPPAFDCGLQTLRDDRATGQTHYRAHLA